MVANNPLCAAAEHTTVEHLDGHDVRERPMTGSPEVPDRHFAGSGVERKTPAEHYNSAEGKRDSKNEKNKYAHDLFELVESLECPSAQQHDQREHQERPPQGAKEPGQHTDSQVRQQPELAGLRLTQGKLGVEAAELNLQRRLRHDIHGTAPLCRRTGIRPPNCGKTLPYVRGRAWRRQSSGVVLANEWRRVAG